VSDTFAAALKQSGAPYVVMLSSVGADKPERTGPILGLRSFEQKLNSIAGLNALYLRATYFLENFLPQIDVIRGMGLMAGGLSSDLKIPMIATRDIGAYAAEALVQQNVTGTRAQELLGAEDASSSQVAAIIANAIGRSGLTYVKAPQGQLKSALMGMGMPEKLVGLLLEMTDSLNNGYIVPLEKRSPANTTPTTVAQFAAEVFAPAFRAKAAAV
jgi:uncharacterized protein YbjT (DUF2867 family)